MQWMQGMQQQGMQAKQMQEITQQNGMRTAVILKSALDGDDQAAELARSMGIIPKLDRLEFLYDYGIKKKGWTPSETTERLWKIEGAQYENAVLDYEVNMLGLEREQLKTAEAIKKGLYEQFPLAPAAAIEGAANARILGDSAGEERFMSFIRKTPTKGMLEQENKDRDWGLSKSQLAISQGNLDVARGNLSVAEYNASRQALNDARDKASTSFNQLTEMMKSPQFKSADQKQKDALLRGAVDAVNAQAGESILTTKVVKDYFWWVFPRLTGPAVRLELSAPTLMDGDVPNQTPPASLGQQAPNFNQLGPGGVLLPKPWEIK
jgi:hypothetical protein